MSSLIDEKYWIGFDLGGTKMAATVFDKNMKVLGCARKKTKAYEGLVSTLNRMGKVVEKAVEDAGLNIDKIAGVGIGTPGSLDLENGVIINAPNLGWDKVALKKEMETRTGCRVALMNDVDAGIYGEYASGAGRGGRCVVGIFPGTGVGGGCVLNGSVLTAGRSSCMEIGHLPLIPNGAVCGCGLRGCLETVASRLAIASAAAAAAIRGEAPYLLENTGTDVTKIRSKALSRSIENGDKAVEQIVRDAACWIGTAAASVVNLLVPDIIVIGGGLAEAMPELFLEEIKRGVKDKALHFNEPVSIRIAELEDDAVVTGAAAWARALNQGSEFCSSSSGE